MNQEITKKNVAQNVAQGDTELKIRVSRKTKEILQEFCRNTAFKSYDKAIIFLLSERKQDMDSVIELAAQKKALEELQSKIDMRVESIQKRLSKYADLYFKRIIDNYTFSQRALVEISERIYQSKKNTDKIPEDISDHKVKNRQENLSENDRKELEDLRLQREKDFLKIRDYHDTIRGLKFKFQEKRSGFSKVYEARLSPEEYQKIFD